MPSAVGKLNTMKVTRVLPHEINGTEVLILADASKNAMYVRVDAQTSAIKPGDTVEYFDNNGYSNVISVEHDK